MSNLQDLFKNEKLLEKVATAETKEDAKKVCKEEGLEVTDAELDTVAGGLKKIHKVLLIGAGAAAGTAAAVAGTYYTGKHFGWWGKEKEKEERDVESETYALNVLNRKNNRVKIGGKTYKADGDQKPIH